LRGKLARKFISHYLERDQRPKKFCI